MQNLVDPIVKGLRPEFCTQHGITPRNKKKWRDQGHISAMWFDLIQKECFEVGIPCPRGAFNFHGLVPNGDTGRIVQGAAE